MEPFSNLAEKWAFVQKYALEPSTFPFALASMVDLCKITPDPLPYLEYILQEKKNRNAGQVNIRAMENLIREIKNKSSL